jgi:hypothetical protein
MDDITFVGLDVHKATVCIAVAEGGRGGEVRQLGVFENRPEILSKVVSRRLIPARRLLVRRILRRDGATSHQTGGLAMHYIGIDVSVKEARSAS